MGQVRCPVSCTRTAGGVTRGDPRRRAIKLHVRWWPTPGMFASAHQRQVAAPAWARGSWDGLLLCVATPRYPSEMSETVLHFVTAVALLGSGVLALSDGGAIWTAVGSTFIFFAGVAASDGRHSRLKKADQI